MSAYVPCEAHFIAKGRRKSARIGFLFKDEPIVMTELFQTPCGAQSSRSGAYDNDAVVYDL